MADQGLPMLVDTHAHLDFDAFEGDLEPTLQRAREAGLGAVINIALDPARIDVVLEMTASYQGLYAAAGIHPHAAERWHDRLPQALEAIGAAASAPGVVAVGEMGLDLFRNYGPRDIQEKVFRAQLRLARGIGKPIILHNRQADGDILRILDEEGVDDLAVIMHCFGSGPEFAAACTERGYYLGFGGVATFPNAQNVQAAAAGAAAEHLLLETDCPYLAPQPYRGQRNEPAYVASVAAAIASLRGVTESEMRRVTTENACRVFAIAVTESFGCGCP
ncbi:MAG: TatD family hydrolase [Thermaerobacterales bacterium]